MTLDVVVTDKAGHVIRGLKQEDFTLLDNKQPATIRSFAAHEIDTPNNDPQALILLIDDVNQFQHRQHRANANTEELVRRDGGIWRFRPGSLC